MSELKIPPPSARYRLLAPNDLPFVYDLVAQVDPRWWRLSRYGLEPTRVLAALRAAAAGAIVTDGFGNPVACALLAEMGTSGIGMLEYFAVPDPEAEAAARNFAGDLVAGAFSGAPIRRLYYERFDNDPDVLGDLGDMFELEVTFPDFALIDGRFEARTTSVLTVERFKAWRKEADG